jgi:hypothetical protein
MGQAWPGFGARGRVFVEGDEIVYASIELPRQGKIASTQYGLVR